MPTAQKFLATELNLTEGTPDYNMMTSTVVERKEVYLPGDWVEAYKASCKPLVGRVYYIAKRRANGKFV